MDICGNSWNEEESNIFDAESGDSSDDDISGDDGDSDETEDDDDEDMDVESEDGAVDEGSNDDVQKEFVSGNEERRGYVSDGDPERECCPICLNRFCGQSLGVPESCEHTFCFECIVEWSKNINTCPIDRNEFQYIRKRAVPDGKDIKTVKVKVLPKEAEEALEENPTVCEVCRSGDREDRLLLCDGCDLAYHCECLDPPLFYIPIEEWFCPPCSGVFQNGAVAGPSYSRTRRVIPRTRASETVRSRVQNRRNQTSSNSISTFGRPRSTSNQSRASSTRSPRKRKRRSYKRTYKKVVQLARTQKNVSDAGKGKLAARGTTIVLTYKKRRKRRRMKRRTGSKRCAASVGTRPTPSSKQRIAKQLGISKPPAGASMPQMKKPSSSSTSSRVAKLPSHSLFGNRNQLMDFSENLNEDITNIPSTSDRRPLKEDTSPFVSPVNILDTIMAGQKMLHAKSDNIVIKTDGSLVLKESNVVSKKVDICSKPDASHSSRVPMSIALAKKGVTSTDSATKKKFSSLSANDTEKTLKRKPDVSSCSAKASYAEGVGSKSNLAKKYSTKISLKSINDQKMDLNNKNNAKSTLTSWKIPKINHELEKREKSSENEDNELLESFDCDLPSDWESELTDPTSAVSHIKQASNRDSRRKKERKSFNSSSFADNIHLQNHSQGQNTYSKNFIEKEISDDKPNKETSEKNISTVFIKQEVLSDDETNVDFCTLSVGINNKDNGASTVAGTFVKQEILSDEETNFDGCTEVFAEREKINGIVTDIKQELGDTDSCKNSLKDKDCLPYHLSFTQNINNNSSRSDFDSENENIEYDASQSIIDSVPVKMNRASKYKKWNSKVLKKKIKEEIPSDSEEYSQSLVSNTNVNFTAFSSELTENFSSNNTSNCNKVLSDGPVLSTTHETSRSNSPNVLINDKRCDLSVGRKNHKLKAKNNDHHFKSYQYASSKNPLLNLSEESLPSTQVVSDSQSIIDSLSINKDRASKHEKWNSKVLKKIKEEILSDSEDFSQSAVSNTNAYFMALSNEHAEKSLSNNITKSNKLLNNGSVLSTTHEKARSNSPNALVNDKIYNSSTGRKNHKLKAGNKNDNFESLQNATSENPLSNLSEDDLPSTQVVSYSGLRKKVSNSSTKLLEENSLSRKNSFPNVKEKSESLFSTNLSSENLPSTQVTSFSDMRHNVSSTHLSSENALCPTQRIHSSGVREKIAPNLSLNVLIEEENLPDTQKVSSGLREKFMFSNSQASLPSTQLVSAVANDAPDLLTDLSSENDMPCTQVTFSSAVSDKKVSSSSTSLSDEENLPSTQKASVSTFSNKTVSNSPLSENIASDPLNTNELHDTQPTAYIQYSKSSTHKDKSSYDVLNSLTRENNEISMPSDSPDELPATQISNHSKTAVDHAVHDNDSADIIDCFKKPFTNSTALSQQSETVNGRYTQSSFKKSHLVLSDELPSTQLTETSVSSEKLKSETYGKDKLVSKNLLFSAVQYRNATSLSSTKNMPCTQEVLFSDAKNKLINEFATVSSTVKNLPSTHSVLKENLLSNSLTSVQNHTGSCSYMVNDLPETQALDDDFDDLPATQVFDINHCTSSKASSDLNEIPNSECTEKLLLNNVPNPDNQTKDKECNENINDIISNIKQIVSNCLSVGGNSCQKNEEFLISNSESSSTGDDNPESLTSDVTNTDSVTTNNDATTADILSNKQASENSNSDTANELQCEKLNENLVKSSNRMSAAKKSGIHKHLPQVITTAPVKEQLKPKPPNRRTFSFEEVAKLEKPVAQGTGSNELSISSEKIVSKENYVIKNNYNKESHLVKKFDHEISSNKTRVAKLDASESNFSDCIVQNIKSDRLVHSINGNMKSQSLNKSFDICTDQAVLNNEEDDFPATQIALWDKRTLKDCSEAQVKRKDHVSNAEKSSVLSNESKEKISIDTHDNNFGNISALLQNEKNEIQLSDSDDINLPATQQANYHVKKLSNDCSDLPCTQVYDNGVRDSVCGISKNINISKNGHANSSLVVKNADQKNLSSIRIPSEVKMTKSNSSNISVASQNEESILLSDSEDSNLFMTQCHDVKKSSNFDCSDDLPCTQVFNNDIRRSVCEVSKNSNVSKNIYSKSLLVIKNTDQKNCMSESVKLRKGILSEVTKMAKSSISSHEYETEKKRSNEKKVINSSENNKKLKRPSENDKELKTLKNCKENLVSKKMKHDDSYTDEIDKSKSKSYNNKSKSTTSRDITVKKCELSKKEKMQTVIKQEKNDKYDSEEASLDSKNRLKCLVNIKSEPLDECSLPPTQVFNFNDTEFVNITNTNRRIKSESLLLPIIPPSCIKQEVFSDEEISIIEIPSKVKEEILVDDDDIENTIPQSHNAKSLNSIVKHKKEAYVNLELKQTEKKHSHKRDSKHVKDSAKSKSENKSSESESRKEKRSNSKDSSRSAVENTKKTHKSDLSESKVGSINIKSNSKSIDHHKSSKVPKCPQISDASNSSYANSSSSEKENDLLVARENKNDVVINSKPSNKRPHEQTESKVHSKKLRKDESFNSKSHSDKKSQPHKAEKDSDKLKSIYPNDGLNHKYNDDSISNSYSDEHNEKFDMLPTESVKHLPKISIAEAKLSFKQDLKEEIANEVKLVLKPFYSTGLISKEDYKDIMRRAVPKIFVNCHNIINPEKIKKLVLSYISLLNKS